MAQGAIVDLEAANASPESLDPSGVRAEAALAALGQLNRLRIFRLLVRMEPEGVAAGAIAEMMGCPQNTASSHLAILARANLVTGVRRGRSVVYRADLEGMRWLVEYLLADCCNGDVSLCASLPAALLAGACTRPASDCAPA